MNPIVRVTQLAATAGSSVLVDGVSFDVWPGRVTALVGASGSGKTTSALALLGEHGNGVLLDGMVEVDGQLVVDSNGPTLAASAVRGRVVAYMPQHPGSALNPARRIGKTLQELERLHHPGEAVVPEALRAAQIDPSTLRRFPHQFSGGQRQRIALAQALTCKPKVLVLDEPSTGLDSITRLQLVSELQDLATSGLGILLLSHDLDLVRALAEHVVVLSAGQVIESGGPEVLPAALELQPVGIPSLGEPLLQAMSLSASLRPRGRDPVLHEVDLAIRPGQCVGIVGRSGSGKTTLARCLAGLHERYTGRILLDGDDLPVLRKRSPEQNRRVQYVWQEVRGSFDERRPVDQQVARTAQRLRGLPFEEAHAEAVSTLARLGVSGVTAARPPSRLSGGELQRAALARAVLAHADVLVCDEITTALDDRGTTLVVELLMELKDRGTALMWIGHDLGLVAGVADQVLVIDAGRVIEHGPPATVMNEPASEVTERLVRAARIGRTTEPPPVLATTSADTRSEPRR